MDGPRRLPEVLIGLVALAIAFAVVVPVTASIVVGGIKDIKTQRDTVVVTGSARYPIQANLASWQVSVSAQARTPGGAIQTLRAKERQVAAFVARSGLPPSAVSKPPLDIEPLTLNIPTGLKKPKFRQEH